MGILAPAFLAGLLAIAIPVLIHMINRERRETIAFPSLMFLRKVPYKSVRRQKLRHLLLLALRCLAVAIVVAAFARPFFERQLAAAPTATDGREVVILLDRSYSMGLGTRWSRATAAVRTVANDIRATDRVSVIAFDATAAQVVEPTADAARVERVVSTLRPTSAPTRFGPAFRMAAQILTSSEQARREIVLVSDFHRIGFTPNDEVALPLRTTVKTVDVSRGESGDAAVANVAVARQRTGDRVRATVTARIANLGTDTRTVDATLELAGRPVGTRAVRVGPRATAQVVFPAAPVSAAATRAVVRITRDSQPANDAFHFTVAEDVGASVLIIEPPGARANQSLFATRAWGVADDPAVRVDTRSSSVLTPADMRGRSLFVLNEADLPAGAMGEQLRQQVRAGAILLVVPGERGAVGLTPEWRAELPASVGPASDHIGRWASVDFSNALFEPFKTTGRSDFSSVTLRRYRALNVVNGGAVIARLDDGAPLLAERPVGTGRILMWALSLDANWTDAPFHPLWVPLLHQLARRSIAGSEVRSWFTAPHVLDLSREGAVVVESPSGQRTRISPDSAPRFVELRERGFYEVRSGATAIGAGRPVAVNVDLSESDQSHFDPAELVAAVTARGERSAARVNDAVFEGTAQELERRQAVWWYLLFAAVLLLAGETMFSNRLSHRALRPPTTGTSEGTQHA
ncbi:MAG: BatA domain-containing protein [Gemmatimonadota bacterium]